MALDRHIHNRQAKLYLAGHILLPSLPPTLLVAWDGWPDEAKKALGSLFFKSTTTKKLAIVESGKISLSVNARLAKYGFGPLRPLGTRMKASCGTAMQLSCYCFEKTSSPVSSPASLPTSSPASSSPPLRPLLVLPELADFEQSQFA